VLEPHLYCYNSLNQSLSAPRFWLTVLVHKDIPKGLRWIENDNLLSIQWLDSLGNLFNGKLIANVKCGIHGKTGDEPWLNNRKSKRQGDRQTEKVRLYVLATLLRSEPTLKLFDRTIILWWLWRTSQLICS
jgi:hypothetical protein